jgi:hypothetical protein
MPVGIRNIGEYLSPQRAWADWTEALLQCVEIRFTREAAKLCAKTAEIAKGEFIPDADKPVKL